MTAQTYIPPADFVPLPCEHPLEIAVYRMPNGAKHVELVDHSEETWQRYAADVVAQNRSHIRQRKEFRAHLRALASATWED